MGEMKPMQSIPLDRVQQICPVCSERTRTHIVAAWLSLTRIGLETECPGCRRTGVTIFDLLKLDEWIRDTSGTELPEGTAVRFETLRAQPEGE
jgi:hypothetical protein